MLQLVKWTSHVLRECWTPPQHRLFNRTMKVLHADRLARLANRDVENEPLLRRITVDKSAKRLRSVLAGALWDTKMIQVGKEVCTSKSHFLDRIHRSLAVAAPDPGGPPPD